MAMARAPSRALQAGGVGAGLGHGVQHGARDGAVLGLEDPRVAQLRSLQAQEAAIAGAAAAAPDGEIGEICDDAILGVGHTHTMMFSVAHQLRHGTGLIVAAAIVPLRKGEVSAPGCLGLPPSASNEL